MPLELETWRLVAQWTASLGIALALTAVALRSRRGVALAAGSAGLAAVSTLLALGARAGELDAFPIGSTADSCLCLAAALLMLVSLTSLAWLPGAGSSLHTRSQLDQERALSRVPAAVHDSHAAQLQAFLAQE